MDMLWDEFPLEPAPAVERLESRRVARPQSAVGSAAGGDSDGLPLGVLLGLAVAAAGVALAARAAGTHVVQEHLGDGLARLRTTGVPRLHVPRPQVPRLHVPRPQVPRLHVPRPQVPRLHVPRPQIPRLHVPRPQVPRPRLPQLPSNRVVQHLADALDRGRQTVWHADVLFWTSAMAAATAFGVLIALLLGGP